MVLPGALSQASRQQKVDSWYQKALAVPITQLPSSPHHSHLLHHKHHPRLVWWPSP
jgi:hypothetical protein